MIRLVQLAELKVAQLVLLVGQKAVQRLASLLLILIRMSNLVHTLHYLRKALLVVATVPARMYLVLSSLLRPMEAGTKDLNSLVQQIN